MADYPLIIVAECDYLEPAFRGELVDYVRGGGNVLLLGPNAAAMFADALDVTLEGSPQSTPRWLEHGGKLHATHDVVQKATVLGRAEAIGRLHAANDAASASTPAASIATLGKGKIAATYFSVSRGYLADRSAATREFFNDLVRRLFPRSDGRSARLVGRRRVALMRRWQAGGEPGQRVRTALGRPEATDRLDRPDRADRAFDPHAKQALAASPGTGRAVARV